jgi:hypothetical protein
MKWEVQLTGDAIDLEELSKSLDGAILRITQRSGQYFLEWSELEELTTHDEVAVAASSFLQVLSGASHLALGARTPIGLGNTTKLRPDGKRETHMNFTDTVHVRTSETQTIKGSDGSTTVIRPGDPVPGWMNLALADSSVAKALRLLGNGAYDWVSLYRLFEVLAADAGGIDAIDSKGWATKSSIKRFKHTANSPAASGDLSRHGTESTIPPPSPMDLSEAKALVTYILHEWLREKIAQQQAAV